MKWSIGLLFAIATANSGGANEEWSSSVATDDFSGDVTMIATSPQVEGDPYGISSLAVRCINEAELDVYFGFGHLNRTAGTGRTIQVKFGSAKPNAVTVTDALTKKALFVHDWEIGAFVEALIGADALAVRLHYHDVGQTTIRYDMSGARPQIERILTTCGNPKMLSELGLTQWDEAIVQVQMNTFAINREIGSLGRSFRKSLRDAIVRRGLACNKATKAWLLGPSHYHVICDKGKREYRLDAALPDYGLSRPRRG